MCKWGSNAYHWTKNCYAERPTPKKGRWDRACSECGKSFIVGSSRFGLYGQWLCPKCYAKFLKNMGKVLKDMRTKYDEAVKHYNKNKPKYALEAL